MQKPVLCIVGLGYVGLPLAHAFAAKGYETYGYDISAKRIEELKEGHDRTLELNQKQLQEAAIHFSCDPQVLARADIVIMALPTPVDSANNPDMTILLDATKTVGQNLKKGAIVVYESTVYPGVTEELCGPILEKESGYVCGKDFTLGYSPERINPGDKKHTVQTIIKIVAGQDEQTTDRLCELYGSIVSAGIHRAPSIKVAEMAKAIENAQRDLNIAYMNEVAMLCHKLGLRTGDVLAAAGTKWNFLPFRPGLVGGHCIGVDPYYLVEKARQLGMHTHVISAGRSINDGMAGFIAEEVLAHFKDPKHARVLILGRTFKEDVPDTRNSKVQDVITALEKGGVTIEAHDPFLSKHTIPDGPFDALLLLVAHKEYRETPLHDLLKRVKPGGLVYDLKSVLDAKGVEREGYQYLSL